NSEDLVLDISTDANVASVSPTEGSATGTISDEDNGDTTDGSITDGDKPTVTVDDASITEGGDLVHTVTVNGVTEADVTYDFDLSNGSTNPAEAGNDYSNTPADIVFSKGVTYDSSTGTITVPAGVTDFTVTYPTSDDNILENDETTTLTIGNDSGTGTILNDDVAPTIEIVNEDVAVTPADNSVTEGTGAIITGTINITNPQSVTALTVGGQDVTNATTTSVTINTSLGELVITGYNATTGKLTYEYTENGNAEDHSVGSVIDQFNVILTDTLGGTKTETLDIQIIDTAPTAKADTNAITEDVGVDPISDKITATGNVITGTPNVSEADTLGADATTVTAVAGTAMGVGSNTTGTYGTLQLNADGTYTYEVDNTAANVQSLAKGEELIETFNYTITDADGDESSTTLTITITGTNDQPTITNVAGVIETVAITEQTDDTPITRTGTINFADTDSNDALTLNYLGDVDYVGYVEGSNTYDFTGNSALISLTDEQKLAIDKLFSINQTDKNTGTWDITAASNAIDFIPAGETITIRYAVQVDDNEGVTAAADGNELSASEIRYVEVTITGTGDGIALVDDIKTVNEDVTLTGNIFDNDTNDPDVGETLIVESYEVNGTTISVTAGTSSATAVTIDGNTIGQLTVNSDGSYTFVPTSNYSGTVPTITANVSNGLSVGDADRSAGSETLDITVTPVSDRPTLSSVSVTTNEDTTVALGLTPPIISDSTDLTNNTDDSSERIGLITLMNVPAGVTLNYGSSSITASGGNITILLSDANVISSPGTPTITMTTADFEAMTLTPPTDSAANISIVMAVTEYEVDSTGTRISGVSGATSTTTIKVDVQAVTDSSNNNGTGDDVSTFGYTAVVGDTGVVSGSTYTVSAEEGEYIDLPITTAFGDLVSTGNSSTETYGFVINNLVEGTVIEFTPAGGGAVQTFTAGIDGKVLIGIDAGLTDADLLVNGGSEPKIRIQTNEFNSQDMNGITVSLYTQDNDADSTGTILPVEIDTVNVNLTVDAVAGQVTANNVSTTEDNTITLDEFGFTVLDTQDGAGAETITQIQFELPAGWTFTDTTGTATEAGGIVTIDMTGSPNLSQITLTPPAQSSTDANFTFTVTTSDPDDTTGTAVTGTAELTQKVTVTPVAETADTGVTINPSHDYGTITASEDTAFALNQGGFDLSAGWFNPDDTTNFGEESHTTDANDSEETYAHLTFGSRDSNDVFTATEGAVFTYNDGTQDISLTDSGSGVDIPAAYLDTVTVTPPADYSDFNLDAGSSTAVKVEAVTIDYDEDTNSSVTATSGESYLTFTVEGVADITTLGVDPATGLEDQAIVGKNERDGSATATVDPINGIKLNIRPSSRDDDGSEVYNVTITDIPAGAQLYVNDDGAITQLTISGGSVTISDYTNAVDNLYFVPAENYSGTVNLKVSAVSVENGNEGTASSVLNLPITVVGQADLILNDELKTATVDGKTYTYTIAENDLDDDSNLIPLSGFFSDASAITPYDGDVPAAEQVTYKVTGVPIGFDITGAVFLGGSGESRSWSVSLEALQDGSAQLVTPDNFAGEVDFTITGTTTETVSGNSATHDTQTVSLVVTPDAADGTMNNPQVLAVEDTWATIDFKSAFTTTDQGVLTTGQEALESVTLSVADLLAKDIILRVDNVEIDLTTNPPPSLTFTPDQVIEVMYDDDKRHSDDDVTIPFDYTYTDTASLTDDSTISSTSQTGSANINVTFQAVTDAPNIELDVTDNTIVISSANDNNSASVIVSLSSDDQDDSESFTRLEITDVPAGIIVEGGILSGGTWYVDVPDTAITDTASTYTLVFTRDPNTADTPTGNIPVTVTGITQDINGEGLNGSEARVSDTFIINLSRDGTGANPDNPDLIATLATKPPLSQTEDGAFKLSDMINAELKTGTASTVSSYTFSLTDLPDGVLLNSTNSAVTVQQIGGIWLVSVDNANGLTPNEALAAVTLTPPEDFSTNDNSDISQNLNFGVEFTALNNVGLETSKDIDVSVEIKPVTDLFDNNLETTVLATNEDTTVAININLTNSADGDYVSIIDGKLYLQLDESGLTKDQGTTGVLTDSNGTPLIPVTLVDGQVGGIPAGTYYVVDVADTDPTIDGINPADSITVNYTPAANEDGAAVVKVYTTHTEVSNISGHDSGTLTYEHSYDIAVAAQPDNLSIAYDDVVAKATGDEDTKIAIDYKINVVDENDTAAAITFDEVPNGYLVYYTNKSGVVVLASNNGDSDGNGNNSWSIDTSKLINVNSGAAGETNNIFIAPPENVSGVVEDIEMTVINNSGMASDPLVIDLDVTPIADEVVFNPSTLLGSQGQWASLNLNAAMVDVDGSETVSIIVSGTNLYGDVLELTTSDGTALDVKWTAPSGTEPGFYVISGVPVESLNSLRVKSATSYIGDLDIKLQTVETANENSTFTTEVGKISIDVKPTLVFNGTDADDELISVNQTSALKYSGGAGNDTFIGGSGNDTFNGDAGNDTLIGNAGKDIINGGAGNDTISGGAGNDTISGGADDDTIDGGTGADTINGGTGNDTIVFDAADLVINGGDGIDTLLINEENTTINFGTFDSSKFESIEVIDMTGNGAQSLTNLSTSDVLDIINDTVMTDKDLIINGDSDDSVSLTATGWTNSGTTTQDGINYNVYSFSDTNGNHDLLIQTDVNTTIL
ncbi:beta strand repeat-containing protein, partial [Psychrobacter sp. NPDC078631]|uniref:beta strand repeat-containing protein n=1 Tax=Psychrobacter sp. NPDC078631 TaxID=3390666 RepID=UPI003D01DDC4